MPVRFKRWALLSSQVVLIQIVVQAINAATGLLLVRSLPKDQYAWFTMAVSLMATINLLGDGGVSSGLASVGGKVYQDSNVFAHLVRESLRLSTRLVIFGFFIAAALFLFLFRNAGASIATTLTALGYAAIVAIPAISSTLLNTANRLETRVKTIQISEAAGAIVRVSVTIAIVQLGWLTMQAALVATVGSVVVQHLLIRRMSAKYFNASQVSNSHRAELVGFVHALYANSLFYCVQGQITTWIISWTGSSSKVADLGALSRLAILFSVILAPLSYLAVPAISRAQEIKILRSRFAMTIGICASFVGCAVAASWWKPEFFLFFLGDKYIHLEKELPLALAAQGLTILAGLLWVLILARGWVSQAWITILTTIIGIIIGAILCQLDSVAGLLTFNLVSVIPTLFFCIGISFHKLYKNP